MMTYEIVKYRELSNLQKKEMIEIFIDGFGHLMTFTKDRFILGELFFHAINEDYVYACVEENKVLGFVGIATNRIRPIKLNEEVCMKLFGKTKGSIICKQMNAIFQSKVVKKDTDLYIDVLATAKAERGKGIGTKLLEYCFALPEYENYYIEVLSKNTNAKALYEKLGFSIVKKQYISFISLIGFGYPIKMMYMDVTSAF